MIPFLLSHCISSKITVEGRTKIDSFLPSVSKAEKNFNKIKVSFLMVGHTHEDIDQMFSRFSTWLNKNDAYDLECLMSGFKKSYTHSNIPPTAIKVTACLT